MTQPRFTVSTEEDSGQHLFVIERGVEIIYRAQIPQPTKTAARKDGHRWLRNYRRRGPEKQPRRPLAPIGLGEWRDINAPPRRRPPATPRRFGTPGAPQSLMVKKSQRSPITSRMCERAHARHAHSDPLLSTKKRPNHDTPPHSNPAKT